MLIKKNLAAFLQRYREERQLSIAELSDELGIAKSAAVEYLNGDGNPRADTMEIIAEKCGVSAAEMISAQPPGWERTESVEKLDYIAGAYDRSRNNVINQAIRAYILQYEEQHGKITPEDLQAIKEEGLY